MQKGKIIFTLLTSFLVYDLISVASFDTWEDVCARSRYQWQGQVLTSHNIYRMWLHVLVFEICAWHKSVYHVPGAFVTLQWRHNGRDSVWNHHSHDCLLNRSFRRRSKKTSKLCVTGLCAGNSPVTGEFPTQMACYSENVSIWWRHHEVYQLHWSHMTIDAF